MGLPDGERPCAVTRTHMQTQALLVAGAGPWVSNSTGAFLCEALLNFLWRPASQGDAWTLLGPAWQPQGIRVWPQGWDSEASRWDLIPSGLTLFHLT